MASGLIQYLKDLELRLSWSWGQDISTPTARAAATVHNNLVDHAFLRVPWTNLDEIAPGVWRSNQPGPSRIRRYARMGIRNVISLRGDSGHAFMLFEREACERAGIGLHVIPFTSNGLMPSHQILPLLDAFDTLERPILFHCKSGADRTSLAGALYLLHVENAPIDKALDQFSLRYLHFKNGKKGIMRFMIKAYGEAQSATGISIRDWLETEYDPEALSARWNAGER